MVGCFRRVQSVSEMLGVAGGTMAQGISPGAGRDPAPRKPHWLNPAMSKQEACYPEIPDRHCIYDHVSILNAFF